LRASAELGFGLFGPRASAQRLEKKKTGQRGTSGPNQKGNKAGLIWAAQAENGDAGPGAEKLLFFFYFKISNMFSNSI
jgi:hypothetical protein